MTAKELIEVLSKLDPEKQVCVGTHNVYETVCVQEFNNTTAIIWTKEKRDNISINIPQYY